MKNNKVLALKYRPQEFKDLIGQEVMVETITNSIKIGKTPNAYLLTGIRGVGKTTTARLIAKSLNCVKNLDDNKANNIISINLKKKSYIADYMIVASGTSSRHLQSLSENLITELKKMGLSNCRIEGKESKDWKLVDAIDVIVHIFHPDKRNFYDLEKMWSEPIPKEKAII